MPGPGNGARLLATQCNDISMEYEATFETREAYASAGGQLARLHGGCIFFVAVAISFGAAVVDFQRSNNPDDVRDINYNLPCFVLESVASTSEH